MELKNSIGVDTSKFAGKIDLANWCIWIRYRWIKKVLSNRRNLKSKVDKLDVDKLVPVNYYLFM